MVPPAPWYAVAPPWYCPEDSEEKYELNAAICDSVPPLAAVWVAIAAVDGGRGGAVGPATAAACCDSKSEYWFEAAAKPVRAAPLAAAAAPEPPPP